VAFYKIIASSRFHFSQHVSSWFCSCMERNDCLKKSLLKILTFVVAIWYPFARQRTRFLLQEKAPLIPPAGSSTKR
jgi:hypothetical protein